MAGINSFIFLYGPPASGKTSIGKALAKQLNLPFVDLDNVIEQKAGRSISEIFETDGEPQFRALESEMLNRISVGAPSVVALGGGALLDAGNRAACRENGDVVCLQLDEAELLARAAAGENQRPLLAGDIQQKLKLLLEKRRDHYASFELQCDVTGQTNEAAASQIGMLLGQFYIAASNQGEGYPIMVGEQAFEKLSAQVEKTGMDGHIALVSDSNVAPHYLEPVQSRLVDVGFRVAPFVIPAGESSKNLDRLQALWNGFLEAGLGRKSLVLSLGGGVVSDLAGYAAASFMRGVSWATLPTSLLGMVDASLGGKTGVNLPVGKNLVGAFHAPRFVLTELLTLQTLPEREFIGGLAEVVKHGVIADPALYSLCAQGLTEVQQNIGRVVSRAVAVKVNVVNQDPFEKGVRASLNLGHTIGHAVENLSDYQLSHGEAVSIGTVAEAKLAEMLGLASSGLAADIAGVMAGIGLPVEIPPQMAVDQILQTLQHDKKRAAGKVRFALPVEIGKIEVGVVIDDLDKLLQNL